MGEFCCDGVLFSDDIFFSGILDKGRVLFSLEEVCVCVLFFFMFLFVVVLILNGFFMVFVYFFIFIFF